LGRSPPDWVLDVERGDRKTAGLSLPLDDLFLRSPGNRGGEIGLDASPITEHRASRDLEFAISRRPDHLHARRKTAATSYASFCQRAAGAPRRKIEASATGVYPLMRVVDVVFDRARDAALSSITKLPPSPDHSRVKRWIRSVGPSLTRQILLLWHPCVGKRRRKAATHQ